MPTGRRHALALLTAALAASCTDTEYRLVLTYPDAASYTRAQRVELYVAEDADCAQLATSTPAPRLEFDAHATAPSLGRLAAGRTAFRAAVRDRGCVRFLEGCAMAELGSGSTTVRIELSSVAGQGCTGDERCQAGACLVADAGVADAGPADRASDAGGLDRSGTDTGVGDGPRADGSPADHVATDAVPVDAVADAATFSAFSAVPLPTGGPVWSLTLARASGTTTLFAAGANRAFRSDDRGVNWVECGPLPDEIDSLAAVPDDPQTVYCATETDVVISGDGCATWQATGLARDTWKLVVRSDGTVLAGVIDGLFRRVGSNWSRLSVPSGSDTVRTLAIDDSGRYWYLGTQSSGLFRSDDSGTTWHAANVGLTTAWIFNIAIDPSDSRRLFASTDDGLFRSTDGALQWSHLCNNCQGPIAISPIDPDFIIADGWDYLRASYNGGDTYGNDERTASMELADVNVLAFDLDNSGRSYAATDRGLFTAADDNLNWLEIDGNRTSWNISSIAVAASVGRVYLATESGPLGMGDGITGVEFLHQGFPYNSWTATVALPTDNSNELLAGGGELRRSGDRGASFSTLFTPSSDDDWEVAAIVETLGGIFVGTGGRLWWSWDDGGTWDRTLIAGARRQVNDMLVVPDGSDVLTVLATPSGVYSTIDGATFPAANAGLVSLVAYAILRRSDGTYLLGTRSGLFAASQIGTVWQRHGLDNVVVRDLFESGGVVIAATDSGVYWESSAAVSPSWTYLPGLDDKWPRSLAAGLDGELLVGTIGYGLFSTPMP